MPLDRRSFLRSGAVAALVAAMPGSSRLAFAASGGPQSGTVIFLLMRGGMDGLNFLAPADDPNLISVREADLRPATSGSSAGWALTGGPTNNDWRLNVAAPAFRDLYTSGQLAFVHAVGPNLASRSHFEVQQMLERGICNPATAASYSGWIARYAAQGGVTPCTFSVVSTTSDEPLSCWADTTALTINSAANFQLSSSAKKNFVAAAYNTGTSVLAQSAMATLSAVTTFATLNASYTPSSSAGYPGDEFSAQLQILAELIKTQAGLQVGEIEYDGWDHHASEADRFQPAVASLTGGLGAFWNDLTAAGCAGNVTIIAFSEFGRRVASNASGGTDHGHGGLAFVLGGTVKGGRIYGAWPGLATAQLDNGDVAATTDYRALLLETLNATRGSVPASFFPGLPPYSPLGFI